MADRLCVASKGKFRSQLSASDLTACDTRNMGCNGGSPRYAASFLKNYGVVTGANIDAVNTGKACYPYNIAGAGEDHFHEQATTPKCESSCADPSYPRSYSQDKYYLNAAAYKKVSMGAASDWAKIKTELYNYGSLILLYEATEEHMGYVSGIWDCQGTGQPNHGARAVGYGTDPDAGNYLVVVNSWGTRWGEGGSFKMMFPGNGCIYRIDRLEVPWDGKNEQTGSPPSQGQAASPARAGMVQLDIPSSQRCVGLPMMKSWDVLGRPTEAEECEQKCLDEASCSFAVFHEKRKRCALFEACEKVKTTSLTWKVFAKPGDGGDPPTPRLQQLAARKCCRAECVAPTNFDEQRCFRGLTCSANLDTVRRFVFGARKSLLKGACSRQCRP
jgi:hypothetical protein